MGLIPDRIARKCPGCTDAYEEVTVGFSHHKTYEDEEESDGGQHGATHFEIVISKAPGKGQPIEIDHKRDHQYNKQVERFTELFDICFKRLNRWYYEE